MVNKDPFRVCKARMKRYRRGFVTFCVERSNVTEIQKIK